MTLTDAGPLFALSCVKDDQHGRVLVASRTITLPMVTTWQAFTETMYLCGAAGGLGAQNMLWTPVNDGSLVIHQTAADAISTIQALMNKYADAPMDLADASLVVLAQSLGIRDIFTFDSHFFAYRLDDGSAFNVIPAH